MIMFSGLDNFFLTEVYFHITALFADQDINNEYYNYNHVFFCWGCYSYFFPMQIWILHNVFIFCNTGKTEAVSLISLKLKLGYIMGY